MPVVATVTPAARRSLTSAGRYRDSMPAVDLPDETLERMISRATALIERRLNRGHLARERVIEEFPVRGPHALLLLQRRPVRVVHAVALDDSLGQRPPLTLLAGTDYAIEDPEQGRLRLVRGTGSVAGWSHEDWWEIALRGPCLYDRTGAAGTLERTYRVEHTAGWIVPETPGEAGHDLPDDLEHACCLVVQGEVAARDRPLGVTAERLGDASWTYGEAGGAHPGLAAAGYILDAYRVLPI